MHSVYVIQNTNIQTVAPILKEILCLKLFLNHVCITAIYITRLSLEDLSRVVHSYGAVAPPELSLVLIGILCASQHCIRL